MATSKKIELMHNRFGEDPDHTCGECCNFQQHRYNHSYFKCAVYGSSASSATDWRRRYTACGHFNKLPASVIPIVALLVPERKSAPQLKGQTCMSFNSIGG